MTQGKEHGFILVTTLIFLLILTMLVLSSSENILLETKSTTYYHAMLTADTAAESTLLKLEGSLLGNSWQAPATDAGIAEHVTLQEKDVCQGLNYLLDVHAQYQNASTHLQSQFQVAPVKPPKNCPAVKSGALWWQRL